MTQFPSCEIRELGHVTSPLPSISAVLSLYIFYVLKSDSLKGVCSTYILVIPRNLWINCEASTQQVIVTKRTLIYATVSLKSYFAKLLNCLTQHAYTHTHVLAHSHMHTHPPTHACTHAHTCAHTQMHVHTHTCTPTHTCMRLHAHTCSHKHLNIPA